MGRYRRSLAPSLLSLLVALNAAPLVGQDAATGTISGRVLDKTIGEPLYPAEVRVEGTNRLVTTDRNGRYRLVGVPAGEQTVVVTFLSFATDSQKVRVEAGQEVVHDVRIQPAFSEEVQVSAPILEGQAKALSQQKSAPNIINVVSSDQIGVLPENNVAEATQRVAGVILTRDDGEGENMIIRGVRPNLNSVTINGERIPSSEADSRNVDFISFPSDILQSVEVSKALTPDMDPDAIGGTVNLVTKQAPDRRLLTGTIEAGYNDLRDATNPKGSLTYGQRFQDGRLGVIVSGSAQDERRRNDSFEIVYAGIVPDRIDERQSVADNRRYSATGGIDWLGARSSFKLTGVFTRQDQDNIRRRERHERLVAGQAPLTGGRIRTEIRDRHRQRDSFSVAFSGTNLLQSELKLDYQLALNQSHRTEPDTMLNRYEQTGVSYQPTIDGWDVLANPLNQNPTRSAFRFVQDEPLDSKDRDYVGQLNLTVPLKGDRGGHFKFGAKYRAKQKDNQQNLTEYTGTGVPTLDQVAGSYSSEMYDGKYFIGPFPDIDTARGFISAYGLRPAVDHQRDTLDYRVEEDVLAGYGLAQVSLTPKLLLLAGLRYEQTLANYTGKQILLDDDGRFVAESPVTGEKNYGLLLPGLHLRYSFDPDTALRFAVTRSMARPNFADLVPYRYSNEDASTLDLGNPELDPTKSWNFDLMFEHYFASVGIVSAGVFFKQIDDPVTFFTRVETIDGTPTRVRQPGNAESGQIWGFEAAYQNRFRSLPSPFDGLGVGVNYTYANSEAALPDRTDTIVFPGQTDHSGNAMLTFEKWGFSSRVAVNLVGRYLFEVGTSPDTDTYKYRHVQWDASASQQLGSHVRLYLNIANIGDEYDREYWGVEERALRQERYSWWLTGGIRFEF
jgi:TonB-dependent receptor